MKKIVFFSIISLMMISCDNDEKHEGEAMKQNDEMKAAYEANLAVLQASITSFEKEDIESWASSIADSAIFNSPAYGDTVTTKAHWKEALQFYVDNWDNLRLTNSIFLPGLDTSTHQMDGSVRYYGTWGGVHKSGKATSVNFYGTYNYNKDHKVINASEYFDVGGMMNAVTVK